MKKKVLLSIISLVLMTIIGCSKKQQNADYVYAFGEGGQIKMLYDRRQRPQSVYLNNKVHIVFNAGRKTGALAKSPTKPMAITYDPLTREFSEIVILGQDQRITIITPLSGRMKKTICMFFSAVTEQRAHT
jgi:hypothetical protein